MRRCARCDWSGDDEAARQHAEEAEHPLCGTCKRESLANHERQTCAKCVARVRADLADIEHLYARLPGLLVETRFPADSSSDKIRGGGEDDPLLGGEPLAMLARGGTGMDAAVWAPGTATHGNREHVADERLSDPPSVADFLAILEDDWRNLLKHPAAGPPSVSTSVAYLTSQLDRMAQAHSEFDCFADDIRGLVTKLRATTGTENYPLRGVECFDCGTRLERRYLEPTRQQDGSRQGGLEDEWGCPKCHRVYEPAEYWLALSAALQREESA